MMHNESPPAGTIVYRMPWSIEAGRDPKNLLHREWLVTNGLGGYASGTLAGICTRRYHGLLIAALPAPLGRMMMFNHIIEEIRLPDGRVMSISGGNADGASGTATLESFSLELGLPVWHYQAGPFQLEKRVLLPHRANTVHLIYRLLSGPTSVRLRLRPGLHFRPHETAVAPGLAPSYSVTSLANRFEITAADLPPLRMSLSGPRGSLVLDGGRSYEVEYPLERDRGYTFHDALWSPGYFRSDLSMEQPVTLSVSTEPWDVLLAINPQEALAAETDRRQRLISQADPRARSGTAAELVLAADQFVITPTTRVIDAARTHAAGDELRAIIAGCHWFTDWGRDTMISLEGLTLTTGRHVEAGYILRAFNHYVRDGLIPNLFPEGEQAGLYHTVDATLWYFHAVDRYVSATHDRATLRMLLPTLRDIVDHHIRGTRFGIGVDPADGLLRQGEEGFQLTWMDAKVGDWVVTPRRGKAVEINALWYNALVLLSRWLTEEDEAQLGQEKMALANRVCDSFNARFWCANGGWLYDVVDGEGSDDPAFRPNQIFAVSLPNAVLWPDRWPIIVQAVADRLLTPMGLRTLAPGEKDYKSTYDGDLRSRDAAYHQGTVWPWLIGPFIDAWLKVHPGQEHEAHALLSRFASHLGEGCIGSISEIFDAEAPFQLRGCIAQAWSVAEVLRCWVQTAPEIG